MLWYSKQGQIGQLRVSSVDKKNNTIDCRTIGNKPIKINYDDSIYLDPQAAIDAARNYNNIYVKGIKQGMFGTEIVYNSPEEIDNKQVKQMLLD